MGDRKHHENFQNNHDDLIGMMIKLQKEIEILKKKNLEELNVLREENARLK